MTMRWIQIGFALMALGCNPSATVPSPQVAEAAGPRLAGGLQPGDFTVGFRKETLPMIEAAGRPSGIDLYLWYPARSSERPALTFADYYRIQESTPPTRETLREWLAEDMTSPPGLTGEQLDAVLDATLWARPEAEMMPQRHPLVLWSYRDSVPTMQVLMNEFLASHGYVVAFAWPVDNAPPLPWQEGVGVEEGRRSLDTQITILETALDSLGARNWVNAESTAVLSWSYGGESAGGLQRRRNEVALVLGIDSTVAGGWIFRGADALAAIDRSALRAPYVLIRHGRPRIDGAETAEPPLLAEVPAGAWHVRLPKLSHGNFNFPGGMLPGVLGLEEVSEWAVGGETARHGYETICRLSLEFLDAVVRENAPAPEAAEASGFVEIRRHPPHAEN